jgi:hypothetical protein
MGNGHCFAKLAVARHSILKEGLTAKDGTADGAYLAVSSMTRNHAGFQRRMAYSAMIRRLSADLFTMFRS